MGKGVEKRGKGEIFTVLGGKNMIFEKGGRGKISNLGNIYPWIADCQMDRSILATLSSSARSRNEGGG